MIHIQVIAYNDRPPPQPLSAKFNEQGGNIGRADTNLLILSDPARYISRTHASIAWRGGSYVLRNLGTAIPVYVNDQAVAHGKETPIAHGDKIRIGAYTMQVSAENPSPSIPETPKQDLAPNAADPPPGIPKDDPLALFNNNSPVDAFADLLGPAPAPLVPGTPPPKSMPAQANPLDDPFGAHAKRGSSGVIPSDFDPFADLTPAPPSGTPPKAPQQNDELNLGFGPSIPSQSIDDLFGLNDGVSLDPFAPADPWEKLESGPKSKSSAKNAQRNDVSELRSAFSPPTAKPDPAMRAAPPAPPVSSPKPYGMVLSWEDTQAHPTPGEIKTVVVPSPKYQRRQSDRQPAAPAARAPKNTAPAAPSTEPPTPGHPGGSANQDELLRAFLIGAGMPDLNIPGQLTPQFMGIVGQLLRESTQGTLDLLLARSLTKREVRADLTMIMSRENNPLKFSPKVEAALTHLLAPQGHGFMTPLQAMKDAYNDLRSHQFGFMAGMRAALAGVLERFNPGQLEQRLTQKTVIDSVIPTNRRAKLWDLYTQLYSDISKEAEDDFHGLFGREFLRAYEAQIAKLQGDKNAEH